MKSLEDRLLEAAKGSDFEGVTLWPTPDGTWQGNLKVGDGWRVYVADDPVSALKGALSLSVLTKSDDVFG